MEEDERNKKLRAGKEKLAAFLKKKSKKKHGHHDKAATSSDHSVEIADSSSMEQSSSSDLPLFEDSDPNMMSDDETTTQDSKSLFKVQTKLKQAIERIAELEECLEGKQLALDRVINENTKLKETTPDVKMREMETALSKRDEIIRQLTTRLQSAASLESDASQLSQHVQHLQTQLINAGKLMESQNSKQSMSSQALSQAKTEIEALQKCIEDKDKLLNQLSEKVESISSEYGRLKMSYELTKQKEEESVKVVKSLMSDAEELRKQKSSMNGSLTVSNPDINVKVQEVRLELDETYGKQIALMKEELSKHYQTKIETVLLDLNNMKDVCAECQNQQKHLEHENLSLKSNNETYMTYINELESQLTLVNSRLLEIQNEKDDVSQQNLNLSAEIQNYMTKFLQTENVSDQSVEEVNMAETESMVTDQKDKMAETVSKETDKMAETVSKETDKMAELYERNLSLCSELEKLQKDYIEAQNQIENFQKKTRGGKSARFEVDSQEIVMELKQVTEQYEEALVNIALMHAKIEDYDIKCENLTDDLLKMKERYENQAHTIMTLENKVKEYEQKHVILSSELQKMTESCESAQKQSTEYRDKFVEYEQQMTDYEGLVIQFNELQHECNVYQTHNDELNNKMNIQQDVVMELKAELEILTNQNQAYQEQALLHAQSLGDMETENKSLQEIIDRYKDEVTKLTNDLNLAAAEVDSYKEKTTSLESKISNLERELRLEIDVESKQKDELIKKLNARISDITSLDSVEDTIQQETDSVEDTIQQETAIHEDCSLHNELVTHQSFSINFNDIENQIIDNVGQVSDEIDSIHFDQSLDTIYPVQNIQSEASVTFNLIEQQCTIEDQSKHRGEIDTDSLDEHESTVDSLEESGSKDNDLGSHISLLQSQNQSLQETLTEENQNLKLNLEKLIGIFGTDTDMEKVVQTFKTENENLNMEKSELERLCKLMEDSNLALNESVKNLESNLCLNHNEKLALQTELTLVNSIIEEISLSRGVSQNGELQQNEEELSQSGKCDSNNVCNKLQAFKEKLENERLFTENLSCEYNNLRAEKNKMEEMHYNELIKKQEENENLQQELRCLVTQINELKVESENSEQSLISKIKIVETENENLNQCLRKMHETEQNLRVQVDKLSQQVFRLSVLNQTVSGDKENLENRFVEVSSGQNVSHDLSVTMVTDQHHLPVLETELELENGISKGAVVEQLEAVEVTSQLGPTCIDPASSVETLPTVEADPTTDQAATLESLKKQYEKQLDSLRQELETHRQSRAENMEYPQDAEDKLEKLDTAEKETVDGVITALNIQHAAEIEHLQQKYLDDVDLKVKAMRITLEQIYSSQLDLVQTELEKKRVQSLKELHDQLKKEHEDDIQRIEMLWEKRLEDIEEQHDDEMNKSLLEESLSSQESRSAQIQKAIKKMSEEHDKLIQKISDGLEKSPKIRTPRKKRQNQGQQTEVDETDTESIRSMPVTEEEYQELEEKEKLIDKAEDVRQTLESQREELDQLRACLLQEYEQLLSTRTEVMSNEAQEVERLQQEMDQLHRLHNKQKSRVQPGGERVTDLSSLKAQYENKISTLEKYHQEEIIQFRDQIEKLRMEAAPRDRDSGSNTVTSSGIPDEQEKERDYVKNTYTMTVISDDDDSFSSPHSDESGAKSLQELKTLLAKKEDEISDLLLKISQDQIEIQEIQFKLTENSDKIQELENKLRVNQSELDEMNSLILDKDCKIDTLMKQKQALGEKCLRELEESENKHAKIVTEINEKFEKVLSDLKISQTEVNKLKSELEASQEQERMLEEQYDELQQQQRAAMKNLRERSEHDNEEIINEIKLEHQKELETLQEKHKEELDSLSEKQAEELEALKIELESAHQEQMEELQHQHKEKIESLHQDMEHESEVEVESLQTEFKVQMEIELKRQAADIAIEHEKELEKLKLEYEQKLQEITSEGEAEFFQQKSSNLLKTDKPNEDLQEIIEEKIKQVFSPREERTVSVDDDDSQVSRDSDTNSQETVIEVSKSEDTVIEAKNKSEGDTDKTENDGTSLDEDKDAKDNTLSESLLQTDQSHDFDQIDSSQDFDQTASSREFTQTTSTLDSVTSSDSSEKEIPSQGRDNTVAVLMQEIARAKEETVKQLQEEYHAEIEQLNARLQEVTEKNIQMEEKFNEEMDKLTENYESKIKEIEESSKSSKDEIEKQNLLKQELIKEHEDNISKLKKEYEEKIELLKHRLMTEHEDSVSKLDREHEDKIELLKQELNNEHEGNISKLESEYEEKIELLKVDLNNEHEDNISKLKIEYEEKMKLLKDELIEENEDISKLKSEYEEKIELLKDELNNEHEDNISKLKSEYEEKMELLKHELVEENDDISKLKKDYEEKKRELIKEHEENVSTLNREYEEKMELLKQELMETFESEKEDLKKQHDTELNEAEEKYESLIDRIKSGEAPEVADIIHERYDSELEMAKSLMQQEFDETIESEQARFMEQHQEMMDKFIAERQQEAEELRMQHEKDIAECRKTIIEEYDARISELEQNQELEIARLRDEMSKVIPPVVDESEESSEQPEQVESEEQDGGQAEMDQELPTDPEIARRRSSAEKDDSIEDLRETHTAIIARIEAEYEEKLKRIKEEMASTHSDDVDGASVDTVVSRKSADQHKQELMALEQHLSEKHKKEIQNLQTQHQAMIDNIEEKYKKEIGNLKKILEFLQHSSSSEDTIRGQMASPAQTVPMLEGLEEEIVPELSGRYVPSRSTPRDDMESSIERVEVTQKGKKRQQISPRDRKEIPDETEEAALIEFDTPEEQRHEEDTGSEISEEPILPSSAPPRELQVTNFDYDAGLDVKPEFEDEDEDFDRSGSYDDRSGRSTPTDLLQTRALADTLADFQPVATYESGDLPVSPDVVQEKDNRIKELEEEIQKLTQRLQDQIEEERLILMRRERESQEGQNLELMLKSDLERVNDDRESVQRTNEQLLQLLSDSVKTYLNVEDSINKKLAKMVAESDRSAGTKGRSPPKDQERSPPAGAEGGEGDGDSLQETSILSNVTDEGLDLSQRISESIFQGPELDKDGEDLLKDASHRLQNSVSRLLDMIEETTNQLLEARNTQHELVERVTIGDQDSNQMNNQVQELQDQLRTEIQAKEYLAVELHKAEGLIEGYSTEREALNQQISDLEEKKEALVLELETTKNKLQDLESIHHEAVSLRAELQRQQALIQGNVGEEAQALLRELNRLNDDKRDLQQQVRELQDKYEGRVRDLQNAGEETERHYLGLLDEKKSEIVDLQLKVDSVEKQLKANKQFLEEQAIEREQELEEYQREVNKWKQEALNKDKINKSENRLQKEVDDLTEQLQDRMNSHSEIVLQTAKLQQDLREKKLTTEELNILVRQLELEIEDKNIKENLMKQKIASLEEELQKQECDEDSGTDSPPPGEEDDSNKDGSRQSRGHRRRRLLPSNVSVKQEEELIHEKEALQKQVEDQMKQISALKNQLDEFKQRGDYGEETQASSLQRKLEREKGLLEEKEQKVSDLQVQIDDLHDQLFKKEQHIQHLSSHGRKVPVEDITSQYDDRVVQLEQENETLMEKIKAFQSQSPTELSPFTQTLLDEKNEEIDHLNDQVHQLQKELNKLSSGEEIVNLRDEVERLQGELDRRNLDFIRASHTSDGSITDSEMPGVSASFAEKTSLQQEINDSVANQINLISDLQQEVEQLKSSLTQREEQIIALKTELEVKVEPPPKTEDIGYLNEVLQEKEAYIEQLNIQLDGVNHEVESLTDFQNKLQEDFDMVQAMLEEKEKEIDMLSQELTQKPSNDETVVQLELEVAKMRRDLAEKDNVIEEKAEEMYMLTEQHETVVSEMKELQEKVTALEEETERLKAIQSSEEETQKLLAEKEAQLSEKEAELVQKEAESAKKEVEMAKMKEELDTVSEHLSIAENLQRKLEEAGMLGPNILLRDKDQEIEKLKTEIKELKLKLESLAESDSQLLKNKEEIAKLKQELAALRIQVRDDRTEELRISHEEIGALRQRLKSADNQEGVKILIEEINKLRKSMRPEDIAKVINEKDEKIEALKCQSALLQHQLNMAFSQEDMEAKEEEILSLQKEVDVLRRAVEQEVKTRELEAESLAIIDSRQPTLGSERHQLMFAVNTQAPMRLEEEEEFTAELATDVHGVPETARMKIEARDIEIARLQEELNYFKDIYGSESPDVVLKEKEETISDLTAKIEIQEDQLRSKEEVIDQLKSDMATVRSQEESVLQSKSEEIQSLQSQLVKFETKIDEYADLKDKLDQYESELDQKDHMIRDLEDECSELRRKMEDQDMKDKLDQYESELDQKDHMIQDLEDECSELRRKMRDQDNKMQQELQKAGSFEMGDDIFAQLQEKQEKLEQTSRELSNTFSKLKDTEEKLEQMSDVKQRLKEAVELSEKQLQIVEQKDQEYMKLKLEIQELIAEKDKTIRELKKEVQQVTYTRDQELEYLTQKANEDNIENMRQIEDLQQQVRHLQSGPESGGGDAVSAVTKLQVQLQENENIMMEMHGELEAVKTKLKEKTTQLQSKMAELEEVRGQISYDRGQIEATAQGQLDQLRQELHIAKTALDEMQREGGWRNSREASVDRETLLISREHLDSDDELEIMDRQELMKEIKELRKDLKTALSELDLFRSTVSMSAKDYVRKVMELREELSQQHQKHIQTMQERSRHDSETNLAQLRIKYEDEIEHIKQLHKTELDKKVKEVSRELEEEHERDMERLLARHQQELELARLHDPVLNDTMTMDTDHRLQSEITRSEKLDSRLLQSLQRQPEGASAHDTTDISTGVSSTEMSPDENVTSKLQMLLNRLHREGVQMLSISELQFLNRHMSPTQIDKEVDVESLRTSWESEKQSLLSAIQSLKDLLAQTHKLRGLEKGPDVSDWRGELLQAISYVFAKERDTLLAELRSHVLSHPTEDFSDIQKLEQKIRNQEEHQKSSLDQIFKADRQSMLAEIRDLRAHSNISLMKHQEEREKMSEQLNTIEDQTTKKERQSKRQVQLLEYKLQQEKILQDDIRSRYDMECERNSELSTLLSREKNSNLDLQTEVSNLQVQISKLKEALEREQSRFVSVSGALDEEKGKSHYLSELLEAERVKFHNIQIQLDDIRVQTETVQKDNIVEALQKELMSERDKRLQADNTYELNQLTISTLRQELDKEQKNFHNMVTDYETKLQQMATVIDLEKSRAADLERELERERYMYQKLKHNLDEERDSLRDSSDREKGMIDEIQMELETEKAKVTDLQRSLDREKKRNNDLMKTVDLEKSSLREELENERQACRQLKNELDQLQLQKLDITRHYEHERDQLNRVKVERDQLRNDMKLMKESQNERERHRDNEKMTEKRTARQIERERDDFKMKLHESDLEMQRLKQKILDLEEQVTVSREKEMDMMRDLEQEKLRILHNQSLEREMLVAEGTPRSEIETPEQRDNWKIYKAQLESLCQSLQYLMLQFQDKLGPDDDEEATTLQNSVKDLMNELRHVQIPLTFESGANRNLMSRPDLNAVNGRVLHHNNELTNFVSRLTEEKIELRKALSRLEEDVWRYRQRDNVVQNGDSYHFSDKHLEDKAEWAKERLSLQLSLNNAERQIEQLQHDLKIERDRRSTLPTTSGPMSDYDKDKMQRLYGKYLRAESYRKALIYQKKYLLLLLGGFQDCEQTTLALIARMGAFPSPQDMEPRTSHTKLFTIFRSAARVVVAVCRMKFLVNKWKRATRVGSPVVSGTVDMQQGYMPNNRSYSPHARTSSSPHTSLNGLHRMSPHVSTASPRFRTTSSPHPTSLVQRPLYGSPVVGHDLGLPMASTYTLNGGVSPLTAANGADHSVNGTLSKDYRSSPSLQNSGARRKILSTPTSSPSVSRESSQNSSTRRVRIADDQSSLHDNYIQRLENLQMKLGSIDSESPRRRSPWR